MQRERQEELSREENFAKSGDQQQSDHKGKEPSTDINMVFMLPMEFLAPFSDNEDIDFPDQIAQLALDPMTTIFEKPADDERQHLKALFVKGRVDGQPITKILIDGGAVINIMPYAVYRKLGKGDQDLTKIDMMLKDFEGNVSPVKGAICIELTIGIKTLPTTFFVISGKGAYNLLLGRDWIHANCCIPSTMHQCLVQWVVLGILNIITKSRLSSLNLVTVPKMPNLSLIPLKPSCHLQHDMRDAVLKYAIALLNK